MPGSALAFSAMGAPGARPQLGPRARFEPILVWTGRTQPTALAAQDDDGPAKAATAKTKPLSRAANAGQVPAAARAFTATEPKPILPDSKGNKGAIAPPAGAQPKPAAAPKPNVGAIAAKPKPDGSAASTAPAGGKPAAVAKPAVAAKPTEAAKPAVKPAAGRHVGQARRGRQGRHEAGRDEAARAQGASGSEVDSEGESRVADRSGRAPMPPAGGPPAASAHRPHRFSRRGQDDAPQQSAA